MPRKLTRDEFILKAKSKHGELFDYSFIEYVNSETKVTLVCRKCGSIFSQTPHSHLRGYGCDQCVRLYSRLTVDEFVKKSKLQHGEKYDYSKCNYTVSRNKVNIFCKQCKEVFIQIADSHIRGSGCPKCNSLQGNTEQFIKKAKLIYGDKYNYNLTTYTSAIEKVVVYCNIHKSYFEKMPNHHLNGQGCPECSSSGFKKNQPALLYYLRVGGAYKIGITNRSVLARFSSDDLKIIKILKVWEFENGRDALAKEQWILKTFKNAKYSGAPLLSSGNSELFNYDILGEDHGAS